MNVNLFDLLAYLVAGTIGSAILFVVFRWRSR